MQVHNYTVGSSDFIRVFLSFPKVIPSAIISASAIRPSRQTRYFLPKANGYNSLSTYNSTPQGVLLLYNKVMEKMSVKNYLATNPVQDRRSKYGNMKTEYNGYVYMSKKEADYARELDYLKKATNKRDRVVSYERQVPFQVIVNNKKICKYLADFKVLYADGRTEIIDVKGVRTNLYSLKKKLVEAQYDILIVEK